MCVFVSTMVVALLLQAGGATGAACGKAMVMDETAIDSTLFPTMTTSGDVDSDGDEDVIVASASGVFLHVNSGNGEFGEEQRIYDGNSRTVVVDDVIGSSFVDLVVSPSPAGGIYVLPGFGNGTFGPPVQAVAPFDTFFTFGVADVNGDGDLDVYGAPDGTNVAGHNPLSWYENTDRAAGTFGAGVLVATRVQGGAMSPGDFDGDGDLDFVYRQDDGVEWARNNGAGFSDDLPISDEMLFSRSTWVAALDVNGDGNADVVTAAGFLYVYLGNGDGTFAPGARSAVISNCFEFVGGDVDGDGDMDLVCRDQNGFALPLLLGNGIDWFEWVANHPGRASSLADVNGDGKLDIVGRVQFSLGWVNVGPGVNQIIGMSSLSLAAFGSTVPGNGSILLFPRTGFLLAIPTGAPPPRSTYVSLNPRDTSSITPPRVGDIDGDGFLDILWNSQVPWAGPNVAFGSSDGVSFTVVELAAYGTAFYQPMVIGDVNQDGLEDVAAALKSDGRLLYWINMGGRTFDSPRLASSSSLSSQYLHIIDVDGDGFKDVSIVPANGLFDRALVMYGGVSNGVSVNFTNAVDVISTTASAFAPHVFTDLVGSPALDVVYVERNSVFSRNDLFIAEQTSPRVFAPGRLLVPDASALSTRDIIVADVTNDGVLDIVVADTTITRYFRGLGSAEYAPPQFVYRGPEPGSMSGAAVVDMDLDGVPDIVTAAATGVIWSTTACALNPPPPPPSPPSPPPPPSLPPPPPPPVPGSTTSVITSNPLPSPPEEDSPLSSPAVIGGVVGGFVLISLVVVVGVMVMKRRRRSGPSRNLAADELELARQMYPENGL